VSDSALLAHDLARGVRLIAGVDEVGRACLAGPIMAAGVLFDLERLASGPSRDLLDELNDSKRLTRAKRERLAPAVLAHAEVVSLVSLPASEIDRIGIQDANLACLGRALRSAGERAEPRLVDGELALGPEASAHELIVHGDATSATVAAASIVAKVARDRLMTRMGERYPGYGFERHKLLDQGAQGRGRGAGAHPLAPPQLRRSLLRRVRRVRAPARDSRHELAYRTVVTDFAPRQDLFWRGPLSTTPRGGADGRAGNSEQSLEAPRNRLLAAARGLRGGRRTLGRRGVINRVESFEACRQWGRSAGLPHLRRTEDASAS
jgi:ribonuclease HII